MSCNKRLQHAYLSCTSVALIHSLFSKERVVMHPALNQGIIHFLISQTILVPLTLKLTFHMTHGRPIGV
jgi:hypothetical protein